MQTADSVLIGNELYSHVIHVIQCRAPRMAYSLDLTNELDERNVKPLLSLSTDTNTKLDELHLRQVLLSCLATAAQIQLPTMELEI